MMTVSTDTPSTPEPGTRRVDVDPEFALSQLDTRLLAKLAKTEPLYGSQLAAYQLDYAGGERHGGRLPRGRKASPERALRQLKEKIKKRDDVLRREAAAHATDLRRLGREAHVALLELAGFSVDEHTLTDFAGRTVAEFTTAVKVEA